MYTVDTRLNFNFYYPFNTKECNLYLKHDKKTTTHCSLRLKLKQNPCLTCFFPPFYCFNTLDPVISSLTRSLMSWVPAGETPHMLFRYMEAQNLERRAVVWKNINISKFWMKEHWNLLVATYKIHIWNSFMLIKALLLSRQIYNFKMKNKTRLSVDCKTSLA